MDDPIAFLRARLADDAAVAHSGHPDPEDPSSGRWIAYATDPGSADLGAGPVHLVGAVPENPSRTRGMDWAVCETGQLGRAASIAAHIARHDPARVLAEVDAKRRILELHSKSAEPMPGFLSEVWTCNACGDMMADYTEWPCDTLRLLALPYADHPDYDDAWRP